MFTNTLPQGTKKILRSLKKTSTVQDFYLSGGTGLALQIGHRESQDLDFFSEKDFNSELLQKAVSKDRPFGKCPTRKRYIKLLYR